MANTWTSREDDPDYDNLPLPAPPPPPQQVPLPIPPPPKENIQFIINGKYAIFGIKIRETIF